MVGRPSSRLSLARLLVHCWSVTGLSLVCHCSLVWSVARPSLAMAVDLPVALPVALPLMHRSSACLCITDLSARLPLVHR